MVLLEWVPGLGHWRLGQRQKGGILLSLFALLLTVALVRAQVMFRTLIYAFQALAGKQVIYTSRHLDFLFSTLFVLAALLALGVYSRICIRRAVLKTTPHASEGHWSIVWRQFRRNRLALVGATILLLLYLSAFLAPFIATADPTTQGRLGLESNLPPSPGHFLGTDRFARDVFSRIIYGSRISLLVGLLAVGISVTIGTVYGALSGYYGGRVDSAMMRMVDIMLSFPSMVLIITIIAVWRNQSIWIIIAIIGVTSWMGVARLVRGEFLLLKELDFFQAARALGAGTGRLMFRHLLPNAMTPIMISATLSVGGTILLEAGLSYLGLGVQPPTPSWGNIVYDTKGNLFTEWWMPLSAGLAIVITVVGYNLLGDGLRDALDPRLRR